MLSPPLPIISTFLTSTNSSSPALAMYEAVILDPWASCGVADRIAELEMVLIEWCFEGLLEGGQEVSMHPAMGGMEEAETKDLAEEGNDGALARV